MSGRELQDESKHANTTGTAPVSRGTNSQGKSVRRKASAQRTNEFRLSLDKDIRGDSSVTGTVSSGASHRRRLRSRQQRLQYFARSSREDITALPGSRELNISPHLRPVALEDADIPYNFYAPSASHTSMPNLPGSSKMRRSSIKRAADNTALPKRQSTKRRKDEHVREEEIRAMSGPANTGRPRRTTYDSGILRKDSKRIRGGLNRNLERPMSDVSLPLPQSVHSSMSGGSDPFSYHLSRLELFAPRPMIRQSINGQYASGLNASMWSARADSRATERRANRKPTPSREILKEGKTVDALADNLDSSDLRAVLERDQRRKDQKRQKEMEKAKRRLERKAEKERAREMGETDSPSKRKRKDLEKHLGLGIESPLLSEVEAPKRKKKDLEKHLGDKIIDSKELAISQPPRGENDALSKETSDYTRALQTTASSAAGPSDPAQEDQLCLGTPLDEAALLNIHPAFRPSPAGTPVVEQSRVQLPTPKPTTHDRLQKIVTSPPKDEEETSPDTIEALPPLPSSPTKAETPTSRQSSRRSSKGWTSIFRRGPSLRKEQERNDSPAEPASFSNVSRESISRNIASRASFAASSSGPVAVPTRSMSQTNGEMHSGARRGSASTAATRRDRSGTPVRTMSKFREDLPELPPSTTDLSISRRASSAVPKNAGLSPTLPLPPDMDVAEGLEPTASEDKHLSTGLVSESLASVDSEASWLSGRPVKHASISRSTRNSRTSSSANNKLNQSANASQEHLSLAGDGHLTRDSSRKASMRSSGKSSKKPSRTSVGHDVPATSSMEQNEEGDVTEDMTEDMTETEEYFRRSSIQENEALTLKTGDVGRTPTLVGRGSMVKSREGLLNEFKSGADEPSAAERSLLTPEPEEAPGSPVAETPLSEKSFVLPTPSAGDTVVQRANSVKVGHGHARQVSAGSAKLLDIPPRRPSTSHGPSSAPSSQAQTPTKVSTHATPAGEISNPVDLTPPRTAEPTERVAPEMASAPEVHEPTKGAPENISAPGLQEPLKVEPQTLSATEPQESAKLEPETVSAPEAQEPAKEEEPMEVINTEITHPIETTEPQTTEPLETVSSEPDTTAGAEAPSKSDSAEAAKPVEFTPPQTAEPVEKALPETDAAAGAEAPVKSEGAEFSKPVELTPPRTAEPLEKVSPEATSTQEVQEPAKVSPETASATESQEPVKAQEPQESAKSDSAAFV